MKRIMKIGLAAVCAAGLSVLATSCGGSEKTQNAAQDPNKPVTLTVWCWDQTFNIYAMNTAAEIYKRDNPNVTVNVVETHWDDLQQKLSTSTSATDP